MEKHFFDEDFEQFLKQKTDQHKLYPSDKVWKGIYQSLHTRKRWFKIGGSLLFFSALLFINYEFNSRTSAAKNTVQQTQANNPPAAASQSSKQDVANRSLQQIALAGTVVKSTLADRRRNSGSNLIAGPQTSELLAITGKSEFEIGSDNLVNTEEQQVILPGEKLPDAPDPGTSDHSQKIHGSTLHIVNLDPEETPQEAEINWLQEMAAIKLTPAKRNLFNLQFYFSPTISYRKLSDGNRIKDFTTNAPLAVSHLGVNSFVNHKPAIGVELGSNVLFSPLKNLTFKSGLQINYSRYSIKAYNFYFEKANIALTSVGRVADTMTSYTSIRNFNGYSPEELQNQYVQVSLPVGAELKLLGNERLQLNVAGTIQPTYLLFNDTYLLSTDYANYTKEPSLVRKWNVHTSAEAFISYYIGGMRWQAGPQFRYQTLSSFNDRYPIKEYLIEYGIKIGVSKTLK